MSRTLFNRVVFALFENIAGLEHLIPNRYMVSIEVIGGIDMLERLGASGETCTTAFVLCFLECAHVAK